MMMSDNAAWKSEKADWGEGPWKYEQDRLEWDYHGYPCLMVRSEETGAWCGYVGVPPEHPLYKKKYQDVHLAVHGGVNYSSYCSGAVCHRKVEEPHDTWWLGFHCGHALDFSPAMESVFWRKLGHPSMFGSIGVYRDVRYVQNQVYLLARAIEYAAELAP